jgi:ketosteroid isomerase-like protein
MKMAVISVALLCLALSPMWAQDSDDDSTVTKVLALEHAWNQAEQRKDAKALEALFDNDLVYVDYDGTLRNKSDFLARTKATTTHPEVEITESMTAHKAGAAIVVTGIYLAKGVENGKPYVRRGRFVDTWISRDGNWLCVVSQSTPILH